MDGFRKSSLTLHRWLGRIFVIAALLLGVSGMLFYPVLRLRMKTFDVIG
jgi:uncharacterized membrane protein YjgN (DUF898 family)